MPAGALTPAVHISFDYASHVDGEPVAEVAALVAGFGLGGVGHHVGHGSMLLKTMKY
jgi:hypothetical protein